MKRNNKAVEKAKDLIKKHQYVLESEWSDAKPSSDEENRYLENHGWDDYAEWHLGVKDTSGEKTKNHFGFPFGDFKRVHRSGLIAAKQRAAQNHYQDIISATDELLEMLEHEKADT